MKKILVATDFSERSDRALRRAVLLAKQNSAGLSLIHVVDNDPLPKMVESQRSSATRLLSEMVASVRDVDGLECESEVIVATPFSGICKAADDFKPDLLVLGPHRRQILRDVFIGTTAERVVRTASCPVLMANATPAGPYRNVLLTTDLSDASSSSIQRYEGLGIGRQTRSSVVYFFPAPVAGLVMSHAISKEDREQFLKRDSEEASLALSHFLSGLKLDPAEHFVRHSAANAAHGILAMGDELAADLIVVGTRGKSGIEQVLLGSVAEKVIKSAEVDVLAIPPTRAES